MDGRIEDGFWLLVIALIFFVWGMLRLDAWRRYRGARVVRGEVVDWNKYRGWKGSMARSYYEVVVRTPEGALTVRTNSGKARKYRKKKDAALLVPELAGTWERLAQYTQNRVSPSKPPPPYFYHHPQETGVILAETVPKVPEIAALLTIAAIGVVLSVLGFMGAFV